MSSTHIISCGRDAGNNFTLPVAVDGTGQLKVVSTALDDIVISQNNIDADLSVINTNISNKLDFLNGKVTVLEGHNDGNVSGGHLEKLKNSIGAGNVNHVQAVEKLNVYAYGLDTTNSQMKPLKLDTNGRLEVVVPALQVTADTINLSTDGLEALQGTSNSNLEHISDNLDHPPPTSTHFIRI